MIPNPFRLLRRRRSIRSLLRPFLLIALCLFFCEFLVFLIYIGRCDWPADPSGFRMKTVALSDTHIFGLKRGHFFDKLKREWQMYICFQLAVYLFRPNSVFVLGDLFDEGLIADQKQFQQYSSRFFELFSADGEQQVDLTVSVGNHDIGFHDRVVYYPFLRDRFERTFKSKLVEFKRVNGVNVINVNSMAMDGDDCELCATAEYLVNEISSKLFRRCKANERKRDLERDSRRDPKEDTKRDPEKDPERDSKKDSESSLKKDSKRSAKRLCEEERPILLSHFPLFRSSDLDCDEPDSDYNPNEKVNIRPRLGCLTKRSSNYLLRKLQPRLSMNGHTHYGCVKKHTVQVDTNEYVLVNEYTLSSFNYRNRANPSFLLLLANSTEFHVTRCMIPNENHLFIVYILTGVYILQSLFFRR